MLHLQSASSPLLMHNRTQQDCLNQHHYPQTCSMIHAQAMDAHAEADAASDTDACLSSEAN